MSSTESVEKGISRLTSGIKTIVINCLQWGDTGKGKFVDLFSGWADIIWRRLGGANAGHTIRLGDKEYIFHLIPSGILYDQDGKINVMDRGMVIDPAILIGELSLLDEQGISYNHLLLSGNANLTLPIHILLDRVSEADNGSGKIGTTGRGIGPTYVDFFGRRGLTINDLLNRDVFAAKLRENLAYNLRILRSYDPEVVKQIMNQDCLGRGIYYHPKDIIDAEAVIAKYVGEYGQRLAPLVADVDEFMAENIGKKKVLGEGAQGSNLSIYHGTYPYVTPSDCTLDGFLAGTGLSRNQPDFLGLGIIKGFYMTRVGDGPFPTEMGGGDSAEWCNGKKGKVDRARELAEYPDVSVNDADEFRQGMAIRRAGGEYGATTGRPRRVGWPDLPILRRALRSATPNLALTKLDVLNYVERINICDYYIYQGPDYRYCGRTYRRGDRVDVAIMTAEFLQYCQPHYEYFPGWCKSLDDIDRFAGLPAELKKIQDYVVEQTNIRPRIISVGAERNETIFV